MIQSLEDAKEELKRADHLIFITLKYTRTGDVIINILKRLITAFDAGIISLLRCLKEKKKIKEIPSSPVEKVDLLSKQIPQFKKFSKYYKTFKVIIKSKYDMREEYRKYITLTTKGKKPIEVTYNKLLEYFDITKEFIIFVEKYIRKNKKI